MWSEYFNRSGWQNAFSAGFFLFVTFCNFVGYNKGMTKSKIFFWLSISFILGIAIASFYYPREIGAEFVYFLFIFSIISICAFWQNKKVILFSFVLLFFSLGMFLVSGKLEKIKNLSEEGNNFSGEVIISKEPEIKEKCKS